MHALNYPIDWLTAGVQLERLSHRRHIRRNLGLRAGREEHQSTAHGSAPNKRAEAGYRFPSDAEYRGRIWHGSFILAPFDSAAKNNSHKFTSVGLKVAELILQFLVGVEH